MKIYYIKMKNYRQYRDATVEFSTDLQKKVTIIQGNNGTGKSNLLNAITWCLYGEERHIREEDRGLPFVNEKVYHTLPVGHIATVEVELALGREEIEYRINRKAEIRKEVATVEDKNLDRDTIEEEEEKIVWRGPPVVIMDAEKAFVVAITPTEKMTPRP